jgi:hypothetical protein
MRFVLSVEGFARAGGAWHSVQEQLLCDSIEEVIAQVGDAVRVGSKAVATAKV